MKVYEPKAGGRPSDAATGKQGAVEAIPEPGSAAWRKQRPLARGVLDYFPDALMEVAFCSYMGNLQHHKDKPLHWDKSKSQDEADCVLRHMAERGTIDTDGVRHSAKAAWRALANLQRELDAEKAKRTQGV